MSERTAVARLDVERYRAEGLVIAPEPVPAEVLDEVRSDLGDYLRDDPSDVPDFVPDLMASGFGLRYGSHPVLLDAVSAVLGDDVLLWACGMFGKPARVGKPTPWHQDGHYWPIRPLATCTVWLALDRSGPHNGGLRYVAGSHRARALLGHQRSDGRDTTLNQRLELDEPQRAAVRVAELEPGHFSLHDVHLVHGSSANVSGARRAGITFRYMPATSYYDRDLARRQHRELGVPDISGRVLYRVRGVDRTGRNDTVDATAGPWTDTAAAAATPAPPASGRQT
ncbi:phytanoyl-CoA dioxygenase family protein [Frankia sp. QA3]|uniref:phytanoyl-CoA dioxygenase family protein n=1 Tax=Frankia sp. QA3 TaxID=710111 RepID=UPI000269C73C|nr:phytanoyl-CoA dioxygenase family protein [Frankia sp. QA3]EIV94836.1 protein involved in biosynthesis of mitomycin antibiotics/polyketide fumonisin [Frankia sp. QA3]